MVVAPGRTTRIKKLLGAPGIATKDATIVAPGRTTTSKKLLGAPGIPTRSKDATRGSWPYYSEQEVVGAPGIATRSKDATRGPRSKDATRY